MNTDRNIRKANPPPEDDAEAVEADIAQEEEEDYTYEDLKRIMKELLFQGARRDIKASFELSNTDGDEASNRLSVVQKEVTPYDMLMHFQNELPLKEFLSLKIILVSQLHRYHSVDGTKL